VRWRRPRRALLLAGYGFSREFIGRVREASDILAVAESYGLRFRKSGRNAKALCPFHQEKTSSFSVRAEEGYFYCFGCHEKGDVFHFVMLMERVEFPEAVEMLADRAGIPVIRESVSREEAGRTREKKLFLYRLNRAVMRFYERGLWESDEPAAAAARRYLGERGIAEEAARSFHLGLAPDSWDALAREFGGSAARSRMLVAAGLAREREGAGSGPGGGGIYDLFRKRIIFPILDEQGRAVGFGGRSIGGEEPKYINSPETAVFNKGRLLFGLDRAREALRAEGARVIVVEGYTDVVLCHQHGLTTAVAPLGTALGRDHALLLRRRSDDALLVFDGDEAGQRAAERTAALFLEGESSARVVLLPEGKDPADILTAGGAEALRVLLERPLELVTFLIDRASAGRELSRSAERVAVEKAMMEIIGRIPDEVLRAEARRELAQRLDLDERSIYEQQRAHVRRRAVAARAEEPEVTASRRERAERELVRYLLAYPEILPQAAGIAELGEFQHEGLGRVAAAAIRLAGTAAYSPRALLDEIEDERERTLATGLLEAGRDLAERDEREYRERQPGRTLEAISHELRRLRKEEEARSLERTARAARAEGREGEATECETRLIRVRDEIKRMSGSRSSPS